MSDHYTGTSHVAEYAVELVERCEKVFGDDVQLGQVVIVAEVRRETADDPPKPYTEVVTLCSDPREYVQVAVLEAAIENVVAVAEEEQRQREAD